MSDVFARSQTKKKKDQGGEAVDEAENLKESEQQKDEENKKEKLKSCKEEKEKQASVLTTVRKFRPEWKQLCSWLEYKDSEMFCLWCSDSDNMKLSHSSSSFATTGCTKL